MLPDIDKGLILLLLALPVIFVMMAFPQYGIFMLFLFSLGATLYHGVVAGGLYKEPLLSEFRRYGEEPKIYPVVNLLAFGGLFSFAVGMVLPVLLAGSGFFAQLLPSSIFMLLGLVLLVSAAFMYRRPMLRVALPLWYAHLLHDSTRQERRHIGWAWLRLPLKMRVRLNGDNRAFKVWVELVRLTVIYGAYDPKSPWHRWT